MKITTGLEARFYILKKLYEGESNWNEIKKLFGNVNPNFVSFNLSKLKIDGKGKQLYEEIKDYKLEDLEKMIKLVRKYRNFFSL